jgi:diaminopimelate epimerase
MSTASIERWEALGNVYLLVEEADLPGPLDAELARRLCDPSAGPGADGVLALTVPDPAGTDVYMRIRNPDGSESEACGNGTRMVARWYAERTGRSELVVGSEAGPLSCSVLDDGRVAARLARATLSGPQYDPDGATFPYAHRFVSVGNPHVVIPVDDPAAFPLAEEGPALEHHPRFPERTNVEIVAVVDDHRLRLRVWERGVGETAACGTGACAAAVAGVLDGLVTSPVLVELPGGTLEVVVEEDLGVTLIGPAQRLATSTIDELIGRVET